MTLSIWVPVGYIGALVLSLSLFSSVYRKRSARNAAKGSEEPWHPEGHPERDVYQSLIGATTSGVELPDHLLKAALLNRAMTDVRRIIQMRDDKQALAVLLQKGSVGDATMARFALAEKELEAEILDVVSEANTFREGWGQLIFPTASEMVTHKKHKEVYYSIPEERNKQIALLKAQNKPVPKPNIELPPLFTPPGTQVKVHAQQGQQGQQLQGPPGAAGVPLPPGMTPAQMQQIIQAQRAARSQQLGQALPGQVNTTGSAAAAAAGGPQVHGPPRPPTGPAADKANGATTTTTPPVVKAAEGDATATTATAPPLTPSSKGNSNGSAAATTPAEGEDPASAAAAAVGSESFDSTLDEDDDDEGGDSGEEGSAAAGTASPGGAGGGVNRAQRRQNKKKQKKGGKK